MKNIVIFSGAGVSQESGIPTFRDSNDGLYLNSSIEDAFSIEGWKKDRKFLLDIHNQLRAKMQSVQPNDAHLFIKRLEKKYNVTVITQNIDNLHEKAHSSTVYHLHGEIFKSRSTVDHAIFDCYEDINIGDKCPKGSQLRPHTVLFGENPYHIQESYDALMAADILIVVGTSLSIGYTIPLLGATQAKEIYYIDPEPSLDLESVLGKWNKPKVKYIKEKASVGMAKLFKRLI